MACFLGGGLLTMICSSSDVSPSSSLSCTLMDSGSGDWERSKESFLLGIVIIIKTDRMRCTELVNMIEETRVAVCDLKTRREFQKVGDLNTYHYGRYLCSFIIHS